MDPERQSLSKTRKATIVASAVALTLVVIKISVGIGSGAMVLIASAVDSGLDFMVSMFNFLAVRTSEKPSDHKFNYGRGKVEGLASFVEGLVIAISSLVIVITAIYKIVTKETLIHTTPAVVVMIISTLITACLVLYLRGVASKTGNLVIKADSLHYQMDLYTNVGILIALAIISQTGWHLIDPIISIGIGIYMIATSWDLVRNGMDMLLDHALPAEITAQIEKMIPSISDKISSFHELKTRNSASVNFVDVHLVFQRDISLMEAHRISDRVEQAIMDLQDCIWVINCHMDPIDDSHKDKAKGP